MMEADETSGLNQPYAIGQTVSLAPHVGFNLRIAAVYKILAVLPEIRGELQYRVKSADESHERMVSQGDIVNIHD